MADRPWAQPARRAGIHVQGDFLVGEGNVKSVCALVPEDMEPVWPQAVVIEQQWIEHLAMKWYKVPAENIHWTFTEGECEP